MDCLKTGAGARQVPASWLLCLLLGACGSDGGGTVAQRDNSAESHDGEQSGDDDSEGQKPGKKPDAGRDAGKKGVTSGTGDAGKSSGEKTPSTGAKDGGSAVKGGSGLPCNIASILHEGCDNCHGAKPAAGAPMKLTELADFQAAGSTDDSKKVHELVKARINASTKPMPPTGKLAAADLAALNEWLDDGAPGSDEQCGDMPGAGDADEEIDTAGLDCYKLLAHAQGSKDSKYSAAPGESYINFGFQAPWQGTVYGVVSKPSVDNAAVVHHWLLYKEPVEDGSVTETIGQHAGGQLLHGWAPGGEPLNFKQYGSVGMELPASTYSIEIHYNNNTGAPAPDSSGVEVCVQKQKPENVASLSWLGYANGGAISYATGFCVPSATWTGTCAPAYDQPIHILGLSPHLHQSGKHVKAIINSPDGKTRTLHDETFDFNYQVSYEKNEVLMPGETITTTCEFSAPNCAGQSTSQEMCYLYVYAYPAGALVDNGPEGLLMHGDGTCLGQ